VRILVIDDDLESEDLRFLFKARLTLFPDAAARNVDDKKLREMVNNQLHQAGFELEFAFDGAEALEHYRKQGPYDLVLTDLYHPGMDGVELAKAIRRENPAQAIAVFSAAITLGPFLEALWQLRIPVADKLDTREALLQLVEEALTRNRERLAERLPETLQ
jgi:CheY-like chemotaxis protein